MARRSGTKDMARRRRGKRRHLDEAERYAFLSAASRELAATLDYEKTLASIAGRPLPYLGDWCIVDLVEGDEHLRRVAILHPDPDKQVLVKQLLSGWPPSRGDPYGIPLVARSGKYELVREIDEDLMARVAGDSENLDVLRRLGAGSLVSVPMVAEQKVVGAVTYISAGRDAFSAADISLAFDLARLSALAVTNARLHESVEHARKEAEDRRLEAERLAARAGRLNERLLVSALEEMEAAERAEFLEASKSSFMASLSHDLRTPLTAIDGYNQLLLGGQLGTLTTKQASGLRRVAEAVQQILRLVDQILVHARLTAREERVDVTTVNVAAVAQESVDLLRPLADRKDILLLERTADGPVAFPTDEGKLRQVLLNLLSNAIKFTDHGHVSITLEARSDGVHVEVEDTGRGISAADQERIFDRFKQVESGIHQGGSGLGLAICRGLVELLGGTIGVRSDLGNGSTFIVDLPPMPLPQPVADASGDEVSK